jgi:hypothetical protein
VTRGLPRQTRQVKHMPAMPYAQVPAFMTRLTALQNSVGRDALKLTVLSSALQRDALRDMGASSI